MLEIKDLHVRFHAARAGKEAVAGINLRLESGEIMGLVGESGSGKSVTAMAICGLLNRSEVECSGSITLDGSEMLTCTRDELRKLQGDDISVVFQEPMTSLDPVMKIGPQVEESLKLHTDMPPEERKRRAICAMRDAELADPEKAYNSYPHELSGGMLQRVMIAAAIISDPKLLVADEPTTALDVTIQAQILELLKKINREYGTAVLFISHNLNVVRKLCPTVAVMHKGKIVERGDTNEIFKNPQDEYTKRLIAAIPTRNKKIR